MQSFVYESAFEHPPAFNLVSRVTFSHFQRFYVPVMEM